MILVKSTFHQIQKNPLLLRRKKRRTLPSESDGCRAFVLRMKSTYYRCLRWQDGRCSKEDDAYQNLPYAKMRMSRDAVIVILSRLNSGSMFFWVKIKEFNNIKRMDKLSNWMGRFFSIYNSTSFKIGFGEYGSSLSSL